MRPKRSWPSLSAFARERSRLLAGCGLLFRQAQFAIGLLAPLQGRVVELVARRAHTRAEFAAFGLVLGLFCLRSGAVTRSVVFFFLPLPLQLVEFARVLLRALTRRL